MHKKDLGSLTEVLILGKLMEMGEVPLLPVGDNRRYDIVIDRNGTFIRIQCKTAWIKNECVTFSTCSKNKRIKQRNYKGEADLFMAYCPELKKFYSIKVDECGNHNVALRLTKPKNNQIKYIRYAEDYEI